MHIPQHVVKRFADLKDLFEQPLHAYASEAKVRPSSISMRLKVLGVNEASAAPWIVIMCDKSISKKVKQYFEQPLVKQAYQPCHTDCDLPYFDIFVLDRAPKPIAATDNADIYGRDLVGSADIATWCGTVIRLGSDETARLATIWGLVQVLDETGESTLYGMTAGHALFNDEVNNPREYSASLEDDVDEEPKADSSPWLQQEGEFELDLELDEDSPELDGGPKNSAASAGEAVQEERQTWSKLGQVFASSRDYEALEADLDWALIKIDHPAGDRPNLLQRDAPSSQNEAAPRAELYRVQKAHDALGINPREVRLLGGVTGSKVGMLSTTSSFLMMAPGRTFVETYTLTLSDHLGMLVSQYRTSMSADLLSSAQAGRLRLMGSRQGDRICLRACGRI
jgi:hypothetical protein